MHYGIFEIGLLGYEWRKVGVSVFLLEFIYCFTVQPVQYAEGFVLFYYLQEMGEINTF